MIKTSSIGDWGIDSPGAILARFSSRGLTHTDSKILSKIAGESFAHRARNLVIEPGLEANYQTALASSESHGYNRNGDGYTANMLAKRASSFVSHGRAYRNHKAKDPLKSYGIIKMAEYDPNMGIVHIIGGLFKDAATAEKFGGGNVADIELDLLNKKGSYPVSQGSSILGGDRCVICGKVSTKKEDYCVSKTAGGQCDLFGCRDGLSKVAEDGRHQALDNPDGIFHDLSYVGFGADRQAFAYALSAGDLAKQASCEDQAGIGGAAWLAEFLGAEGPAVPTTQLHKSAERLFQAANQLASMEKQAAEFVANAAEQELDFCAGLTQSDQVTLLSKAAASENFGKSLNAADLSARLGVCVSPLSFFKSAGLCDADVAVAVCKSASLFQDLQKDSGRLTRIVKEASAAAFYTPITAPVGREYRNLSLDRDTIVSRALEKLASGVEATPIKHKPTNASVVVTDKLDKYAVYRLRTLSKIMLSSPLNVRYARYQANVF